MVEQRGKFVVVGNMTTPRTRHLAILLNDGRVLIAGGEVQVPEGYIGSGGQMRSAEIYNPDTGKFTATGRMVFDHPMLAAVRLADGNVLFVGGPDAEIYDVREGRFEATGKPVAYLADSPPVLLKDGNVLAFGPDTSCELYFTKLQKFRETSHTHGTGVDNTILLPDGRALMSVGRIGYDTFGSYFELFDPETETFRVLKSPHAPTSRAFQLDDGRIFFGSAFFHPADDTFTEATGFVRGYSVNSVALLQNGKLLIAGGAGSCSSPRNYGFGIIPAAVRACIPPPPTAQAWWYDPQTQTQLEIEDMNVARSGQTATTLKDGSVLIAGGRNGQLIESSADLYVP